MKKQNTTSSLFPIASLSILLFLIFVVPLAGQGQDAVLNQSITTAIKATDATALASHFDASVDLSLPDTEGAFSKKQAEQILKMFFNNNPPKQFTSDHSGSSGYGASYIIGTYTNTESQKFRVYILIKPKDSIGFIQQLQFEEE